MKVNLNREALLERLRKHRDAHGVIAKQAIEGYRARLLELVDKMVSDAQKGRSGDIYDFKLPPPIIRTRHYDDLIDMYEMCDGEAVEMEPYQCTEMLRGCDRKDLQVNAEYSEMAKAILRE